MAAQQEQQLLQRLSLHSLAKQGCGSHNGSSNSRSSTHHLVQLTEGWTAAVTMPGVEESVRCVCLAMRPLHQTAAQVLHFQGARGRRGLPLPAVKRLARQALMALDALHRCNIFHHMGGLSA